MTQRRIEFETLHVQGVADGVVVVTLNRPEHGNAVVPQMARDLLEALATLEDDPAVRALVLTGAGRQFCSGADLGAFRHYVEHELIESEEPFNARVLAPVTQRLATLRIATIAAINGGATAGGLDLALACDIRLAAATARMGETYIRLGLSPFNGGSYFLPRLIGSGMAAELSLTGDLVDAARALQIGLVNHIFEPEQLLDESVALAVRIAALGRLAVEATKQQLRTSWQTDLSGSMAMSYWAVAALHHTRDLREGVVAAQERRSPLFNSPSGEQR